MASDFCFVGTAFPSRVEFLEAMDLDHSGMDVLLAGQWQMLDKDSPLQKWIAHDVREGVDNDQTAQIYRSAKTSLNFYRREADRPELVEGWAMGPREVEMAACGLFFVRDPRPEGDEVLSMLPTYDSPADATAKLRWWLEHDEDRAMVARAIRARIADRTFDNAAKRLLTLLEK
jgi:spore maturation protein CgeB